MKEYDYATIRKLVDAAFGDEDLNLFCHDHFVNVYDGFTAGQTKGQRLLLLVEHVRKHGLTDKLLREIAGANPHQYNLFKSRIKDDVSVSAEDEPKGKTQPAEEKREKIRFLHLSDLHLTSFENKGPAEAFNQDIVTGSLVKSVGEMDLAPDFIVITGDIARTGKAEEYKVCEVFLKKLLEASGLNRDRLFLTPGNHDVDRGNVTQRQIKSFYHFEDQDEVTEILSDPDICPILMRKFENFNLFSEKALNRPLFDDAKFWFAETLSLRKNGRDYSIKVVGLNSCLFAGYDGDDRQNLSLGLFQVGPAVESRGETVLSVGFFHHPFSCFHPSDKVCQNLLVRNFDMILTGHLHDPSNAFVRNAAGRAVIIGAGAGFETRESRNSFNVTEIDPETGNGTTQFYKYLPDFNLWKKDTDVNPDTDDGCFAFCIQVRDILKELSHIKSPDSKEPLDIPFPLERLIGSEWESFYLKRLIARCDPLDMASMDETCFLDGSQIEPVRISDVFTNMFLKDIRRRSDQTTTDAILRFRDRKMREVEMEFGGLQEGLPINAVEAVGAMRRMVILGSPGGGKSTLVNHLAALMAKRRMDAGTLTRTRWPGEENPLPVRIILRRFASGIGEEHRKGSEQLVWGYLKELLGEWGCSEFYPALKRSLDEEGGVVFFDGLDEVLESDVKNKRSIILDSIRKFSRPLEKCRIFVTCREYAWHSGEAWRLPESEFPVVELDNFHDEQIDAFVHAWHHAIGTAKGWTKTRCETEAENLVNAIRSASHFSELAPNPLLLTLMAIVHGSKGLPEDRADLYKRSVNLLLAHWENRIVRDEAGVCRVEPSIIIKLNLPVRALRIPLERIALNAHERQETNQDNHGGCADIPKYDILEELEKELGSLDRARDVAEYIQNRTGLLQARDNRMFAFPHRTFQEYLCATGIMRRSDFDSFLKERVNRSPDWWQEVFLLAAGASRDTPRNIYDMLDTLLGEEKVVNSHRARNACLAARAMGETNFWEHVEAELPPGRFSKIHKRVRDLLSSSMIADDALTPRERVDCGTALNWVGDPRFNPGNYYLPNDTEFGFVRISAGPFMMGINEADICALEKKVRKYELLEQYGEKTIRYFTERYGDSLRKMPLYRYEFETPRHEIFLPDYYISRYPVTKAQFRSFIEDSDYETDNEWCKYGSDNHPVVMISWYDAVAYCEWLTERLNHLGFEFRLPTEAEWEKATGCSDGSTYPWGSDQDNNRANYYETGLKGTSPVGCFPKGKTNSGLLDMIGNVAEWTLSIWGKHPFLPVYPYPYQSNDGREDMSAGKDFLRIRRGGGWFAKASNCRSTYRSKHPPIDRINGSGFRLVRIVANQ